MVSVAPEYTNNIIPYFAHLVKEYKDNGSLIDSQRAIKVVCWNTEWKESEKKHQDLKKLRLEDYYTSYKKEKGKSKQDYDCLKHYLMFYDKKENVLKPLQQNILNALLKILRIENITSNDERPYTKKKMIDYIRDIDIVKYEELNLNILNWTINVINGQINRVFDDIKSYIPIFFTMFSEKRIERSLTFVNSNIPDVLVDDEKLHKLTNLYTDQGLDIEITSVHAVKGQTHCATLYLESFYYNDGNKTPPISYESQRLKNPFLGKPLSEKSGERVKQSAKMAYVGFSRPSSFLCVAIHKNRFDLFLSTINKDEWEIKEVP